MRHADLAPAPGVDTDQPVTTAIARVQPPAQEPEIIYDVRQHCEAHQRRPTPRMRLQGVGASVRISNARVAGRPLLMLAMVRTPRVMASSTQDRAATWNERRHDGRQTAADRRHHPAPETADWPKRRPAPRSSQPRQRRGDQLAGEGDGGTGASVTAPIAVAWLKSVSRIFRTGAVAHGVREGAGAAERLMANPVTQRVLPAGIMGGQEAAMEAVQGEPIAPWKVAISAGAGAVMNRATPLGEKLLGYGAAPVRTIAGHGATPPTPETAALGLRARHRLRLR